MTDSIFNLPYRATALIEKYDEGHSPETHPPDETVEQDVWFEADGSIVTDPGRIQELELGISRLEALYGES